MDRSRALQLARRHEDEGYRWLFSRYRDAVYRAIRRVADVDVDGANDALQETFIRAFNHLEGLHNDDRFEAWLVRKAQRVDRVIETLTLISALGKTAKWALLAQTRRPVGVSHTGAASDVQSVFHNSFGWTFKA